MTRNRKVASFDPRLLPRGGGAPGHDDSSLTAPGALGCRPAWLSPPSVCGCQSRWITAAALLLLLRSRAPLVWGSRSHTLSTSVAPLGSIFQPSTNFTGTKHFLGEKKKNEMCVCVCACVLFGTLLYTMCTLLYTWTFKGGKCLLHPF